MGGIYQPETTDPWLAGVVVGGLRYGYPKIRHDRATRVVSAHSWAK